MAPDASKARQALANIEATFGSSTTPASTLDEVKGTVGLFVTYINAAEELFKTKMNDASVKSILVDELLATYAQLVYMKSDIEANKPLKYVDFIEKSQTAQSFVESKPFKATKDLIEVRPILIDSYKGDTLFSTRLPFYTSGNVTFEFSTGFFLNNLREDSYYIEKRDADKANVLVEHRAPYDVSAGALGHISYKICNTFRAGLVTGAALSPFDGKVRYLIGGGFAICRQKQIGVNAGLALARLKTLSNAVKSDAAGAYVPISVTTVPTYDKTQSGFFIGLTYNLISIKK